MKLLQIIPTYKPAYIYGGTITAISLLCETLVAKGGCQVTALSTTANGKEELPVHKHKPLLVDGVEVYYFPRWTKDHTQFSPALLIWLWRNVKKFDAVHIHSWWNISVLLSAWVCILRGVKPVLSPHGMLSPFTLTGKFKPYFHRFLGKKLLKNTLLHTTSEQETSECLALIPEWEHINLPNFIDLDSLPFAKKKSLNGHAVHANDTIRLLFLSRLHQKKGIELLFEALAQLPFKWSLTMAGDGESDYIEGLKKQSKDLHIDDKINWLGWVNAEKRLAAFETADLLVLTSHNENFAIVVIESLAVGTPVLVSKHVGLANYVSEKNLGWVCDTTTESIRDKLMEVHSQTAQRIEMAERSSNQIRQDFDPSILVQRYMNMYKNHGK